MAGGKSAFQKLLRLFGAEEEESDALDAFRPVFEQRLALLGAPYEPTADGRYRVRHDGAEWLIAPRTVLDDYAEDEDPAVIDAYLAALLSPGPAAPGWEEARDLLVLRIAPLGRAAVEGQLIRPLSRGADMRVFLDDPSRGAMSKIGAADLVRWGVPEDEVWEAARAGLDRAVDETELAIRDEIPGRRVLQIQCAREYLNASLLLSRRLHDEAAEMLGSPIWAAAPFRDVAFLISRREGAEAIGAAVAEEHAESAYRVSHEIWELDGETIRAVGRYAPETRAVEPRSA